MAQQPTEINVSAQNKRFQEIKHLAGTVKLQILKISNMIKPSWAYPRRRNHGSTPIHQETTRLPIVQKKKNRRARYILMNTPSQKISVSFSKLKVSWKYHRKSGKEYLIITIHTQETKVQSDY